MRLCFWMTLVPISRYFIFSFFSFLPHSTLFLLPSRSFSSSPKTKAAKKVGMETVLVKSPKKFVSLFSFFFFFSFLIFSHFFFFFFSQKGDERSDEEVTIEAIKNLENLLGVQFRVLKSRRANL